jgi:heat shock protein HslJ
MNYRKFQHIVVTVVVLALLSAGCSNDRAAQLSGTSWILKEMNGSPAIPDREPTLVFEKDQVSGSGSCNHFGGSYQVKNDRLTFGALAATLMACAETEVMEQESAYFAALQATARFEMEEGKLSLMDEGGKVVLVFVSQ